MNGIYSMTLKAIIEPSNIKRKTLLEQPVQPFRSYDTPPAKTSRWIFLILRNVLSATGISWHSGWTACGLLGKGLGDWYRTLNLNLIVFLCLAKLFPNCGQPKGGNVNIQNTLNDYFMLSASVENNFILTGVASRSVCAFKMKSSLQKEERHFFSSYPINSYVGKRSEGGLMCPWKDIWNFETLLLSSFLRLAERYNPNILIILNFSINNRPKVL